MNKYEVMLQNFLSMLNFKSKDSKHVGINISNLNSKHSFSLVKLLIIILDKIYFIYVIYNVVT